MKFARYLEETQIPEWKRAYIDFKGLKKRISVIQKSRQTVRVSVLPPLPSKLGGAARPQSFASSADDVSSQATSCPPSPLHGHIHVSEDREETGHRGKVSAFIPHPTLNVGRTRKSLSILGDGTVDWSYTSRFLGRGRPNNKLPRRADGRMTVASLYVILDENEKVFFDLLNHELQKVDEFYNARELAAIARLAELKEQLREFFYHTQRFDEAQGQPHDYWKIPKALGEAFRGGDKPRSDSRDLSNKKNSDLSFLDMTNSERLAKGASEYQYARRRLKMALREFYRSLELLNDYRVLNLTGFRKALKKYDKVTKRSVQDLYMKEKIYPCKFSFSGIMNDTMRDVESIYAAKFENGNRKKAREKLKSLFPSKSHYSSMFRSGMYLGLAAPALIAGIYNSFQPHIRERIPQWGPLLEIYFTLMAFVAFSILLGINIFAWTKTRINFAFIFELDVRTSINVREYLELPTFLFLALSYAIWSSFFLVGVEYVSPTSWPIIWTISAIIIMINPISIFSRASRYWLIRRSARLLIAGTSPVGFTDFWLGDQFCSLAYGMQHLYILGCSYTHHWEDVFNYCDSTSHWEPLILLNLPFLSRLFQSVRRYYDTGLRIHLINGGKYVSSIAANIAYFMWRLEGSRYDGMFAIWVVLATISSVYGSLWDILVDWSLLQRHSTNRFLRSELIYSNNPFIYYFAIVTNTSIRFLWVTYICPVGLNSRVLAVIVAIFEMLRRVQWNFYRLENEQIGNTDQYRATREVPLPYSCMRQGYDEEDGDYDLEDRSERSEMTLGKATEIRIEHLPMTRGHSPLYGGGTKSRHLPSPIAGKRSPRGWFE